MGRKGRYTKRPRLEPDERKRVEVVLLALTGQITVKEGARRLGVSRNHFTELMNRALGGMRRELSPRPPGRPAKSEARRDLEKEKKRLERENTRLRKEVEDHQTATKVLREVLEEHGRAPRTRRSRAGGLSRDEDDDEPLIHHARHLRALGIAWRIVSLAVGRSERTLRRHAMRARAGEGLVRIRGPGRKNPLDEQSVERVRDLVRQSRGLMGAEALSRSVEDVSRREADRIKKATLRQMELERRQKVTHIRVTQPGAIRGFDQHYVHSTRGKELLLISSDACIPYRTSVCHADRYDAKTVANAVDRDFSHHGPPLVWRADNARSHKAPRVSEVLSHHRVLALHGPCYYPCFYGQTERQNREHRAWLELSSPLTHDAIVPECTEMLRVLNCLWRRRTLGWETSEEAWGKRPRLDTDRDELREEVEERAARIRSQISDRRDADKLSWRLAIEQALTNRGLLVQVTGGWC